MKFQQARSWPRKQKIPPYQNPRLVNVLQIQYTSLMFSEKRVHFHFPRPFAVLSLSDRSFSYRGYDDEEYPMLVRGPPIFPEFSPFPGGSDLSESSSATNFTDFEIYASIVSRCSGYFQRVRTIVFLGIYR